MSTKYELATELRQLTRGTKPGPICRMKKHELEAEIDRIKTLRAVEVPDRAPAKPGPLGPREVKVRTVMREGVSVVVPEVPKLRVVRPGDAIRIHGPKTVNFGDDAEDPFAAHAPQAKPHRCNCPSCPIRHASTATA